MTEYIQLINSVNPHLNLYHIVMFHIWGIGISLQLISLLIMLWKVIWDYADERKHVEIKFKAFLISTFPLMLFNNFSIKGEKESKYISDNENNYIGEYVFGSICLWAASGAAWPLAIIISLIIGFARLLRFTVRAKKTIDKLKNKFEEHINDKNAHTGEKR